MKTGQLIKDLRLKKGITQEELAAQTDISVRTIQRIENGEVDPRAYTLQTIAAALGVDFEILANSVSEAEAYDKETSRWLPLLHLSGILVLVIPPILVWIWKRDQVKDIRKHAIDVINFQLSMFMYLFPCLLFGIFPLLIILAVYSQVIIVLNTVKVTSRQDYRYPLSIRFLKQERTSTLVSV